MLRLKAAAAVLGLLALAGCNGEPDTAPTPTVPSSSASENDSASASEGPPEKPREFVERYFATVGEAIMSGDPDVFLAVSTDDCGSCTAVANSIRKAQRQGIAIEGAFWRVTGVHMVREASNVTRVRLDLETGRETWRKPNGQVKQYVRAERFDIRAFLSRRGGDWKMRDWELIES